MMFFNDRVQVGYSHDWDSWIFWQKMNWRNFTWIYLNTEIMTPFKYVEISAALLGFHLEIDIFRKFGKSDESKSVEDMFNELEIK